MKDKTNKIMRSKKAEKARNLTKKENYGEEDTREYQYNSASITAPHKTQLKKWVSEESSHSHDTASRDLHRENHNYQRNYRRFYKDDADFKKTTPEKSEFADYEEEKVEIVYEEIVDDEESTQKCRTDVCLDDFRVRKVIDKGSFGEVFLTEFLPDGKMYAMKRIK